MTITGKTRQIDGKAYHIATTRYAGRTYEQYFFNENSQYSFRGKTINEGIDLEFFYLDDQKKRPGEEWTNDFNVTVDGFEFEGKALGEIVEKGITHTVAGRTFKSVIHTQLKISYKLFSDSFTEVGQYQFFTAKGVGLIKTEWVIGGGSGKTELIEFSIK